MRSLLLLLSLLFTVVPSSAQTVYKVVAADGTVTYTDKPVPGSEPVRLTKLNTAEPLASPSRLTTAQTTQATNYTIIINNPAKEATIRNNLGEVTISANIQPVASGSYQLHMDGGIVATSSSGVFRLSDIERGAHLIKISFVDNKGKILASSEQQTFYMHKASALINSN